MSPLTRSLLTLALVVAAPLAACSSDGGSTGSDAGELTVTDVVVGVPPNPDVAAVRMVITNGVDVDDALTGGSTPAADRVEVHRSDVDDEGRATMTEIDRVPVPAGSKVTFAPGGLHLMVTGLHDELAEGDSFPLALTFERAGTVDVTVQVVSPDDVAEEHDDHG